MKLTLSLIERLATWKGILGLLVIYSVVFGGILVTLGQLTNLTGGFGILDFDRGYSMDRVQEVLGSYGPDGMALNARIQLLDLFNPALYSLILACLTFLLWKGRGPNWLPLVALLGGVGDYLENITLFLMARSYPDISDGMVNLSSSLSLIKNVLLPIAALPFLIGLVIWLASLLRARQS
jgi:hypothetical protein